MKRLICTLLAGLILLSACGALAEGKSVVGPVLVGTFPKEAKIIQDTLEENGDYSQTLLVDGLTSITTGRWHGQVSAEDAQKTLFPDAKEVKELRISPVSAYPATQLRFTDGANEDTRVVDLVVLSADEYTFYFASGVPIDAYDGENGYADLVSTWIESLDIFDPDEGEEIRPFDFEDVITDEALGASSVQDYLNLIQPVSYSWYYEGEATGATILSLLNDAGSVDLTVYTGGEFVKGKESGTDTGLDDETLKKEAHIRNIRWNEGFTRIVPGIRGIELGWTVEQVKAMFPAEGTETLYDIRTLNPQADASWTIGLDAKIGGYHEKLTDSDSGFDELLNYTTCTLNEADEWREYYTFTCYFTEGKLAHMRLLYDHDAE